MLALLIPAFFGVVAGVEVLEAADPEYVQLGIGVLVGATRGTEARTKGAALKDA